METDSLLEILTVDLSPMRRYSLAELDGIDFSTSDDFAIVVENMRNVVILGQDVDELWNEEHEQMLWHFVIDPDACVFVCYIHNDSLNVNCGVPTVPVAEFFYFIKTAAESLSSTNYDNKIMYGTARAPYFESLYELLYRVYSPMFMESTEWAKCIKSDYLQHLSKFLSELFDLRNKLLGELAIYVPKEVIDHTVEEIIENQELLNQVERAVMKWIWHFMGVLMNRGDISCREKGGPLEEIQFWEEKGSYLNDALNQLNRDDVKKCVQVLKTGKSGCLQKVTVIYQQIQDEQEVTMQNVKFLSILKKSCEIIETSPLIDIPMHSARLLDLVRIIWKNSSYFKNNDEISSLLSKVNNFILRACSSFVPLDEVFGNADSQQKDIISDVIQCCNSWAENFDLSEKAHKKYAGSTWSVESVSPLVNLFIHRCEELLEICEYKELFCCDVKKESYVQGHRCYEIAEQFEAMEEYFWNSLQELKKHKLAALDIHTALWYDYFKRFQADVHDLEFAVTKLMSNSYQDLCNIEEGIEILLMFKKYLEKEIVKKDLQKCIKSLHDIFFNEVKFVKKKLFESKTAGDSVLPMHGGTAFTISLLPRRLKQEYKVLKEANHIWPQECDVNIDDQYQQVLAAIDEFTHTLFLQFMKSLPKDPYSWLKCPVVTKVENSPYIQLNIKSDVVNLIEELYYWDKAGVEIPHQVMKLHEKSDVLFKRTVKMQESVNKYNRIIKSLSVKDGEMFSRVIESLAESILPSLTNLNWSAPQASMKTCLKVLTEQSKFVKDSFTQFESSENKISSMCSEIGKKCLFFVSITSAMEFSDFISLQIKHKETICEEILTLYQKITGVTKQTSSLFKRKKTEEEHFFPTFIRRVSEKICNSLITCFEESLKAVASIFGINRKNKLRMVIKILLTLKDEQLYFDPHFKELCIGIDNFIGEVENDLGCLMDTEEMFSQNVDSEHFHAAVKCSEPINELRKEIDYGLFLLYEAQKKYKSEWEPFSSLWETSKSYILNKYEAKGWKASDFEEDINKFLALAEKVPFAPRYKSLDFCICDCYSLKESAIACAEEWKNYLGSILLKISCSNLQNAYSILELTSEKFKDVPRNLAELKLYIRFLIRMKKCASKIQTTFSSLEQNFSVLKKFQIPIDEKFLEQQKNLDGNWKALENSFRNYYVKLQKVQATHQRHFLAFYDELERHAYMLEEELIENGPFQLKYGYANALNKISSFKNVLHNYQEKERWIKRDSVFFHLDMKSLDKLMSVENELGHLKTAWMYAKQLEDYTAKWGCLAVINFDVLGKKQLSDSLKEQIKDLATKVKGHHWLLLEEVILKVNELDKYYNVILNFQEPTLQQRHWEDFKNLLRVPYEDGECFFKSNKFSFEFLRSLEVENLAEKVSSIATQAKKEYAIEQTIKGIDKIWENVEFKMVPFKKVYQLESSEKIVDIIENHQTSLGAMKASKYISYFSEKVDSLENSLSLILDVIQQAEFFQHKFFFLENIFAEQTVQAQLPKEAAEFQDVTMQWKDITSLMYKEKFAWDISHKPGFLETLTEMNAKIQAVQKSLESYLESKRRAFPRFFFVSDDDLLSIIGQATPMAIQKHLKKCFDSINKLEIVEKIEEKLREVEVTILASGMHSDCNEYIEFINPITLEGPVESWMLEVEEMMRSTLSAVLPKCFQILFNILSKEEFNFLEAKWLTNWPGQMCLVSMMTAWTAETTVAIKAVQDTAVTTPLKNLRKKWREILSQLVKRFQNESSRLMQMKTMTMLLSVVHSCDVIDTLLKYVCNDPTAFEWLVQLRYYLDEEKDGCTVHQTKEVFKYGFEYLGNRERLVITPLTDRCFVTITTALYLHQGVSVKGSRGSGKTETLKELGMALGNYILIINCSESLDHSSLARMVSGLAQIGAWGIFEEFNRVNLEILSVLAQQINIIFRSLSCGDEFYSFLGNENSLKERCGIFIATNPDYCATYEIPSSLTDIFRPMSIILPDILTIIEVYLFASGFKECKVLAADIHIIFKLVTEQLSKHQHYDFGLRAVVNFLKYAANEKKLLTGVIDSEIIITALVNTTIAKLHTSDIPIFEAILESVLGSVKVVDKDRSSLNESVKEVLQEKKNIPIASVISKVVQLHETRAFYHAVILLGVSGSGKSTTLNILKDVYTKFHTQNSEYPSVNVYSFNPKAFSLKELFGYFIADGEWKDGLFPTILREACHDTKADEKWIIFNGPVDFDWLGNISSLLDSSRVLTVANGERILILPEVCLVVETTDLLHSSPGAISRCGLIYHAPDNVGWETYFQSWLKTLEINEYKKIIEDLAEKYLESVIEFSFKTLESLKIASPTEMNSIASFCKLMTVLMKQLPAEKLSSNKLSSIFWFSVIWSIGATANERGQFLFSDFVHNLDETVPGPGSIYDHGLDENMEWMNWSTFLPEMWKPDEGVHIENLMVPTKKTFAYQYVVEALLSTMDSVLLIGSEGSGKTIITRNLLSKLDSEYYKHSSFSISSQTSSSKLQHLIEMQLEKKAGNVYLPETGKKLLVFLDDLNMAQADKYGSLSTLELLHMELDSGFWYNRENWKANFIQNVSFITAMGPPGGGRNKISTPLLNQFRILNVLPHQDPEMKYIFISLLKEKFSDPTIEMRRLINAISLGSLDVYKAVLKIFLPAPTKLHYLFCLRDIKRVFCRLLDANPDHLSNRLIMTKLWFHECIREFSDKLICKDDREQFFQILMDVTGNQFLIRTSIVWEDEPPRFAKFLNPEKGYEEVKDFEKLIKHFAEKIVEYNKANEYSPCHLVLFKKAVDHLCRIIRGIEVPYGNMLLLGANGTGRRSLSKIAAFILKYQIFEIHLKKNYGKLDFKYDLQKLIHLAGVKRQRVLFLLSDSQIVDEIFLQYLSDILTTGEIEDLYLQDEIELIYSEIINSLNMDLQKNECHEIFIENMRYNLHLVFCLTYGTTLYKQCFLRYPGLYKSTTVDWFDEWPRDALETIALAFLKDLEIRDPVEENRIMVSEILSEMQESIMKYSKERRRSHKNVFQTSATFIILVHTFEKVLIEKRKKVQLAMERLESGLQKINETQEKVNDIAKETHEARDRLLIAEKECDKALLDIQEKKAIVARKQEAIQEKKVEIERKERVCKKIAIAAQEDLNAALPALEDARKALAALNKRDIGEIKSYAKPPVLVEIVLEAVMILRGSEPSWAEAKRQLGNPSFLKELMEYDRDNMSDAALLKVGKYIKRPEFQPHIVGKVSVAAKSLCIWVHAMHLYGEIYKKVKPKKERLRIAQEELDRLQKTLAALLKELNELEAAILRLEREHQLLMIKKEEYANNARILALKLERAKSIIQGLSSEKERWNIKVSNLMEKKNFVIGDSFIAAGYLAYLGPYEPSYRMRTCNLWKKKVTDRNFVCNPSFDLADFFVCEADITEWSMCGLPTDQYSHESAVIATESCYCPFIVDPQGQAFKWIKNMEAKQGLKCADLQDTKWLNVVEAAIVGGAPVLLQSMNEDLDPILEPLFKKSDQLSSIYFNNKQLKINPSFRLYILTRLIKPKFSLAIINKICIVNFTIKEKGLEDQLLPLVVRNERSDLEITKGKLVKNIIDSKKQLLEIEDIILKLLSESRGSLLEDEVLVQALNKSKSTSLEVEERLSSSQKTEAIIDSAREKYRLSARNAAILFFVLTDMTFVDTIYVFTLDSYIDLFLKSIRKSPQDADVGRRIIKLNLFHQFAVFKFACRAVCEKHSLLLAFHICTEVLKGEGKLDREEYNFFVKGGQVIDHSAEPPNPCSQWLPQICWDHITQLERLPKFLGITVSFDEIARMWQEWYSTAEPEKIFLPGNWRNICTEFQKLLIVRCLRLDRITSCVSDFIANNLGRKFLEYPHLNLNEIVTESVPNKPLVIFTISSDVDPEVIITDLAEFSGMAENYRAISLGQGQGSVASQLIIDSAKLGYWAFLFNCHLLLSWMPTLERIVEKLRTIKVHPNFRLWLGCHPTEFFPTSILQNSVVLTLDSPKGIKSNMLKLYRTVETDNEHESSPSQLKYRSLLFVLSFFHSILLERKKFQNLGWNNDYTFTCADFKVSEQMLKLYLDECKDIPWDALKKHIAEITYGNHITDERDERLLMTYYEQYFSDEVCSNLKFPLSTLDTYYVPEDGSLETYMKYIRTLPASDSPEVFGQTCNSEIPHRVQEAEYLIENLGKIRGGISKEESKENQVIMMIEDLKQHIPELINEEIVFGILQEKPEPYNYILVQETLRYNSLVKLVTQSLEDLEQSISGEQIMTEKLEEYFGIIQKMEVPMEWQTAYPSLKPLGSWIKDLNLRVQQFTDWSRSGRPPIKFWLPGFTVPVGILNATLQITVKNTDVIFKELIWEYHVSTLDEAHIKDSPTEGIYIRGLFLEGAGWDKTNSILIEPEPLHLITAMPVIHFKPVTESSMRGLCSCPCYYITRRTDKTGNSSFLFNIDLKTKKPKEHWIKRGTALIMSNNE